MLAAGFGTRLRPLTDKIPKCLVPIHGKPLLLHWLEALSLAGVDQFLVNTHYMNEKVVEFISQSDFADQVTIAYEKDLLGTAGTLRSNIDFFKGDDAFLVHADNYTLTDMREFVKSHKARPRECVLSLVAFRTETPQSCGILEIDEQSIVRKFHEKVANPPGNLANGAVFLLSKQLVDQIQDGFCATATDFSKEVIPQLMGKVFSWETKMPFLDIGTPEAYQKANL